MNGEGGSAVSLLFNSHFPGGSRSAAPARHALPALLNPALPLAARFYVMQRNSCCSFKGILFKHLKMMKNLLFYLGPQMIIEWL